MSDPGGTAPRTGNEAADRLYAPTVLPAVPQQHTPAYVATDLSNCDAEPIHIPGAIQPHGVLIAVDRTGRVVSVSANTDELLGTEVERALGADLDDLVGSEVAALVRAGATSPGETDLFPARLPRTLAGSLAGRLTDVRTHHSGDRLVVEIEAVEEHAVSGLSLRSARRAIGRLAATTDVIDLADQLSTEIRDLLGFDRAMVYRFDAEWNGEVIADAKHPDLNPFLGLHYPASDIPAQARRLYTVNWIRLIADIGYRPVPLEPVLDPATNAPLDLSFSTLRSVSPVHLEYLANMGVTASLSVSIVAEGKLWGLVACHHYSGPHRPSQDARAAAELLGQVASQMFVDREQAEIRGAGLTLRRRQAAIIGSAREAIGDPLEGMIAHPDLAAFLGATAVAVRNGDQVLSVGTVPPLQDLDRIADLLERPGDYATSTDHLAVLDPTFASLSDIAAGALRIGSASDRYMLWLRPEQVQQVDWGGDPTNKLLAEQEPPGVRLSPRKSFEKWRQVVHGRSEPWTAAQLEAAEAFGIDLQGVVLSRSREQVAVAESLKESVELDREPEVSGFDIAALYLPSSQYQLAGDWWDVVDTRDGRAAFIVGDVAGHGFAAASTMVQMRTSLRAYLLEGHDPMTCLEKLDAFVARMMPGQLATAAMVVVDQAAGTYTGATAGHPPILVDTGSGPGPVTVAHRPVLGVGIAGIHDGLRTEPIPDGASFLLYTDGLVERRGVVLDDSLRDLRHPDLAVGSDDLPTWLGRVRDRARTSTDDDVTMLAFRVAPTSTP
ncbi:chemotaxis family two-component system sensor kinase Cph1 [Marmoricola sp. OAE513]|uniref:SpoIIE family protein phosphatase n=1 Tax=Marmoricola sp. OAE513 TaxID=2817894 RepID=UPI001AEA818C